MTAPGLRTLTRDEALGIFNGALEAARDLETIRALRAHIAEGVSGYGMGPVVSGGSASAPTERRGEALADGRDEYEAEERALAERIELARGLCSGIRRSIGVRYSAVLELYYLRRLEWKQVAAMLGVSKTSAIRLRDVAVGEVAERGTAYLLELARDGGDSV